MYASISDSELNLFTQPARILIAGYSGGGKSVLASKLIRKYRSAFDKVVIIGSTLENCSDLNIVRNDNYNPLSEAIEGENSLIVFDDIIYDKSAMKIAQECFIKGRHKQISCLFLSQNLFLQDKGFRIIGLNCTHTILCRSRDINQIVLFGRSFLQREYIQSFVEVYKRTVLKKQYGYILIDFTKNFDTPQSIRTNIFNETLFETAFELTAS